MHAHFWTFLKYISMALFDIFTVCLTASGKHSLSLYGKSEHSVKHLL